jgi:Rrf2 family transcriptional regulator, iron-sulfur cluster assembly transcription factor
MLAITAVVDIALHARPQRVQSRLLTERHQLTPRHLELMLQELVRANILKATRGRCGGYELARARSSITIAEIVRAAFAVSAPKPNEIGTNSDLLTKAIEPSIRKAGQSFIANLDAITVEDLCAEAVEVRILESGD